MLITAYYFYHHMYTLVPRHVREDMEWMADAGTKAIAIAVLEQDLAASGANMSIICKESQRCGMRVFAVPSRWGGIVAGAPKVPSLFTSTNPQTWVLDENGKPRFSSIWGPTSSIYHPATFEFFCTSIEKLLRGWPVEGIIWDEPKVLHMHDYSQPARDRGPFTPEHHVDSVASFFDRAGEFARSIRSEIDISLFLYSSIDGCALDRCASIKSLNYFGCDGRPWGLDDGGVLEGDGKVLLGKGKRFLETAHKNGKKGLFLVENHNMPLKDYPLMDKRLPEVLAMKPDQLIYYYYPRNLEDPDLCMGIIRKHLTAQSY